jgi:hypothetical protein
LSGHGHVTPNANGMKARCGAPGLCAECRAEQADAPGLLAAEGVTPEVYARLQQARRLADEVNVSLAAAGSGLVCAVTLQAAHVRQVPGGRDVVLE